MSRTLIVGASSPLGTAIRASFIADGHEVHGASRSGNGDDSAVDFTDPRAAEGLLRQVRPDVVVHLARPDPLPDDAGALSAAIADHARDIRTFATHCHAAGANRLLFASSAAVYGTSAVEPRSEDSPTPAPNPYARLKLNAEHALAEVSASTGMATVALRVFNVYGPGFAGSLINRLRAAAELREPLAVFASERFVRDYVHARDAAAAFALAAAAQPLAAECLVVNVGTGVGTSNSELLALVPDAPWTSAGTLGAPSTSVADIDRIRGAWGFSPSIPLAEGVEARW